MLTLDNQVSRSACRQQKQLIGALCTSAKLIRDLKLSLHCAVGAGDLGRLSTLREEYDEICSTVIADVDRLAMHRMQHNC
jgi:hypothetical protein